MPEIEVLNMIVERENAKRSYRRRSLARCDAACPNFCNVILLFL